MAGSVRTPRAPAPGGLWLLLLSAFVAIAASGIVSVHLLVVGLAALIFVVLSARRPDLALLALILLLPFQQLVLAKLYAWGVPASVVRPLAAWKEALGLGVVVAGFLGFQASRKPLDRLDRIALAFVAIVLAYALVPGLAGVGAPMSAQVRSLAFRQTAGFVILFLGARHALLPPGFLVRASRAAFGIATVVAAIAVYEYFFSSAWNNFIVNDVKFAQYQVQILNVFPLNPLDYRVYGTIAGQEIVRVGSVFLSPLSCGFYLLIGFAIGVEKAVRRGARLATVASLLTIGAALVLTQTRSALIGALVIAFCAFRFAPGRRTGTQIQFAFVLLVGLLLALPAASSTGLAARASTTASSDDPSAPDHLQAMRRGLDSIAQHPLGQGLGTSAGVGQRFHQVQTVSESNYLQVGNELGVVAMIAFIALTIAAIRALRRAAVALPDLTTAAIWTATIGLAVGAFFLHTWTDFSVSWTLWGLAGAVVGAAARNRERRDQPTPDQLPASDWPATTGVESDIPAEPVPAQ